MSNDKIIVNISIRDKRAYGDGTVFVCDNSDYVLHFDFDEQWEGVEAKTARIIYSGSKYIDIPFRGNQVEIERTPVSNRYSIGVYANNIKTSTPAFFDCDYSILSTNPFHAPIPEDIYNKIMALIEGADDAIIEVDELPTENIDSHILYNVKGKLFYRVGDAWAEITTDFFDYVKRGEYEEAIQSLTESITEINEGVDSRLASMGKSLKETDDKAVLAHNKAVEVNQLANNALSISSVALQGNQDEVKRATEVERILGEKIDNVESIAKGANRAVAYGNYQTMVMALNALSIDSLTIGQNIMIVTLNVPDLWVAEKVETSTIYNYTTDEQFVETLKNAGFVQVGHFKLSALETQKVDIDGYPTTEELNEALSAYVKSTDYATEEKAGVVKVGSTTTDPLYADDNGDLHLGNDNDLIDQRSGENAIRNQDLDHAIKVGLTGNQLLLTEDDKKKIIAWLGLEAGNGQLGFSQYAYTWRDEYGGERNEPGIVSTNQVLGITRINNTAYKNALTISSATNALIDKKADVYRPLVPARLDYAVMKALTDPITHEWTPEQKGLAQKTLGVGEWIEATKESDYSYRVTFNEDGVYEYYVYLNSTKVSLSNCYSGTFIFDKAAMPEGAVLHTSTLVSDDFVSIIAGFLIPNSIVTDSDLQLTVKAYDGEYPDSVVFKARKIREI